MLMPLSVNLPARQAEFILSLYNYALLVKQESLSGSTDKLNPIWAPVSD
jgi:hypothetical protein